jgi:hypothetical protein
MAGCSIFPGHCYNGTQSAGHFAAVFAARRATYLGCDPEATMTLLTILFAAAFLLFGYFVWVPRQLLRIHDYLTDGNVANELGAAQDHFLKLTRRFCAAPMVLCLVAVLLCAKGAYNDARLRPEREKREQVLKEKLKKYSVGSVYAKPLEQDRKAKP